MKFWIQFYGRVGMQATLSIINTIVIFGASLTAIWLGIRKIGIRIEANYTTSVGMFENTHVSSLTLRNLKDNTICVYDVWGVVNKEIFIPIWKSKHPLLIGPYETVHIEGETYSKLTISNMPISMGIYESDVFSIAVNTGPKLVHAKSSKNIILWAKERTATAHRVTHNGIVITDKMAYILEYWHDNKLKQAIIHKSGFIGKDWEFMPNSFGSSMNDAFVENYIKENYNEMFSNYECYKVVFPDTELLFKK